VKKNTLLIPPKHKHLTKREIMLKYIKEFDELNRLKPLKYVFRGVKND